MEPVCTVVVAMGGDPDRPFPRQVGGIDDLPIRQVFAGGADEKLIGGVVSSHGELYTWRSGTPQQGRVAALSAVERPVLVKFPEPGMKVIEVSCGTMHVMAFCQGGAVYSWGTGTNGQLGHGTSESLSSPLRIRGLDSKGVCQIACGGAHSAALCDNGTTFVWGWNNSGQLGLGHVDTKTVPTENKDLEPLEVSQIACGLSHTCILSNYDRCVYAFGWNQYNQLGTGAMWHNTSEKPEKITTLQGKGVMQIACGGSFSMALSDNGEVYTWGWGEQGQLGLGTTSMARYPEEITALNGKGVTYITACGSHAVATTRTGEMYVWGAATNGQLGIKATQASFTTPTLVDAFSGKHVRHLSCAGGIRAGHTIISLEVGRDGPSGYTASTYVPAAKPAEEEEEERTKKKKKDKKADKEKKKKAPKASGIGAGAMMKKMKEVIESTEVEVQSIQEKKTKVESDMVKLTEEKRSIGATMARCLSEMALSEDNTHVEKCQHEVAESEKKLRSISEKFFKAQKKKDDYVSKEFEKRKGFYEMMSNVKKQQDSQSGRKKEAAQNAMKKNQQEQSAAEQEIERLRAKLAPLDQGLVESQAALEDKNKDEYTELHTQREYMAQLETHISTLGAELQELRDMLAIKEQEYNESCQRMGESIQKVDEIEERLEVECSSEIQQMKDAQSVRDQARKELDAAHEAFDAVKTEGRNMQNSQHESDERSTWLAGLLKDAQSHMKRLEQAQESAASLSQCKSAMVSGGEQAGADAGPSREEAVRETIEAQQAELNQSLAQQSVLEQKYNETESRMTNSSTQLSDLHAQKAQAVSSKNFKQATALSQQIRALTEASDKDGTDLEAAMGALEEISNQVTAAQQALQQAEAELMMLESNSSETTEPPGCNALRELRSQASSTGATFMANFLDAELCVVLACTKAAQGYPDWEAVLNDESAASLMRSDDDEDEDDEEEEPEPEDLMDLWS